MRRPLNWNWLLVVAIWKSDNKQTKKTSVDNAKQSNFSRSKFSQFFKFHHDNKHRTRFSGIYTINLMLFISITRKMRKLQASISHKIGASSDENVKNICKYTTIMRKNQAIYYHKLYNKKVPHIIYLLLDYEAYWQSNVWSEACGNKHIKGKKTAHESVCVCNILIAN